jgi:hypothetical protein
MRIVLLALACILVGILIGNRMAAEGSLPGCPGPRPSTSSTGVKP